MVKRLTGSIVLALMLGTPNSADAVGQVWTGNGLEYSCEIPPRETFASLPADALPPENILSYVFMIIQNKRLLSVWQGSVLIYKELVTTQVGLPYSPMHNFPRCNQRE